MYPVLDPAGRGSAAAAPCGPYIYVRLELREAADCMNHYHASSMSMTFDRQHAPAGPRGMDEACIHDVSWTVVQAKDS